jgi:hypothetical protein
MYDSTVLVRAKVRATSWPAKGEVSAQKQQSSGDAMMVFASST